MEKPQKIWNRRFILLFITNLLVLAAFYPSSYNRFTVKGTAASRVFYRLVAQAVRMREQAA